jgi:DNA-binding NarL/FixJ family response regulator
MDKGSGGTTLTVFIADDSPPVAEMLAQLLASPGRVEIVGVGGTEEAAISSIRRMRPDVVVLDLQLGEGSGTNVIRAVRSEPALAATRLLVTSSHDSPQLRAGCLGLGADGYYDKVKELSALAAALAELAEDKRRGAS